jgi:hypothetical protein
MGIQDQCTNFMKINGELTNTADNGSGNSFRTFNWQQNLAFPA